jgi:hypothetical protein
LLDSLLGAEFTKAFAITHGSERTDADASALHPEISRLSKSWIRPDR